VTQAPTPEQLYLRDELIAGFPPGNPIDWNDPEGFGPEIEAIACALQDGGQDVLDQLRAELSPLTCSAAGVALWEQSLGLSQSRIAFAGTLNQRRAQVISKIRESGTPTLDAVRTVLNAYLQYADPSQIVILEANRPALRRLHTYLWSGAKTLSVPATITWDVLDDAKVSPSGAQVDLSLTADLTTVTATLTSPGGTSYTRTTIGRGTVTSARTWAPVAWTGTDTVRAAWAAPNGEVFAVGDNGSAHHYDGTTWTATTTGTAEHLRAVWGKRITILGTTITMAVAVGDNGTILTWGGASWSSMASPTAEHLYAVWGLSQTNIWAAGDNGKILHWNGTTWNAVMGDSGAPIYAMWGAAANDIWTVGNSGIAQHWDGTAWTAMFTSSIQHLRGVWGSSSTDIWAVGDSGAVAHWGPAGTWQAVDLGGVTNLRAVWGDGTTDGAGTPQATSIWAVGDNGQTYYWNGSTWSSLAAPGLNDLFAVTGSSASDVWAGGDLGASILHMAGARTDHNLRLYFREMAGVAIAGTWTLTLSLSAGTGVVTDAGLFVEGFGRDSKGYNGRGAAVFYWGVMVEDAKLGAGYDLAGARDAVRRMTLARFYATLLRRPLTGGIAAGVYGAVPSDLNALPSACVPH